MSTPPPHAVSRQSEELIRLADSAQAAVSAGRPLDRTLANFFRGHREFGSRDRRLFSSAIFAFFRWRGWLPHTVPTTVGLVMAAMLDGQPLYPALELIAARSGLPKPIPLRDPDIGIRAAQLRDYVNLKSTPELRVLVPGWVADALFYPPDQDRNWHFNACIHAFQTRPVTWLRVDKHPAGKPPDLPEESTPHPILTQAIALPTRLPSTFNPAFSRNAEVQDIASQAVGLICDPRGGERWWDVCAGAGGKTLHLADLLNGTGEIWATDIRTQMLATLNKRRKKHYPAKIKCLACGDGSLPPGTFDGVLVDAPCSGLGTWGRNPDARWRIRPEQISDCANQQLNLLQSAAGKVKRGGRLVYSICTITELETFTVARKFTAMHPEFELLPFRQPLSNAPAQGSIWIWPWEANCNGMFVACWQRV